jgi:hypothetical protein
MARGRTDKTLQIIEAVNTILQTNNPTTVRFLLYRLISEGLLESTRQYSKLTNILRDARIRGEVDDDAIVDNKRVLHNSVTWGNLEDFKETMKRWYSRDRWSDQQSQPIIIVEKATVGDVVKGLCQELQVPCFASQGYLSRPFLCKIANLIIKNGRSARIAYIGDHDASGLDMERASRMGNDLQGTARREGLFEILTVMEGGMEAWENLTWERLAITEEDLASFSGPQLVPVKEDDTRAKAYIERYGRYGAEVEALNQTVLLDRVRDFITLHTDPEMWAVSEGLEKADVARLAELQ